MSTARTGYVAVPTPESTHFPAFNPSASSLSCHPDAVHVDVAEDELYGKAYDRGGRLQAIYKSLQIFASNNNGLLLVAASQIFFSLMNLAVKVLNGIDPPVSTFELIVVRMGITYICSVIYMYLKGIPDPLLGPKGVRLLLIFRGASGFFGLFGIYYSLIYLSLSDATVLTFLAPLCTTIAGGIFLGERFSYKEIVAGMISLSGVILIARPAALFGHGTGESTEKGTAEERLLAVGVAMIGVLGGTGAYISIRAIGTRAHALHSVTFFSMLCVIVGSAGMIINRTPIVVPQRFEWLIMLIMIGIFGFVGQFLLAMGLQRETAGRGTMAIYTQVIFAAILERIFFNALPSVLSFIGTVLIMGSAMYIALTKKNDSAQASKSVNLQRLSAEDESLEAGLLQNRDDR